MKQEGFLVRGMDPLVSEWFLARYASPTPVQTEVWEGVAKNENILAQAPTGSGKTLAAFLVAFSRFASGDYDARSLSVLYISPLKALNEDIRRNLLEPTAGISAMAKSRGVDLPEVRVDTRSGDTPDSARRHFLSRPPSILCTTPESLAILLDSPRARPVLATIRLVIVDEIHAVAGTKRGAHLAASLGRLALLAGEFQRLALSATLRSPDVVARWFGGLRSRGDACPDTEHVRRVVRIVAPPTEKKIEFAVSWPGSRTTGSSRYESIVPALLERIRSSRTTIVFCDARRRAERIATLLNEAASRDGSPSPVAWAHHGSLSKEVRTAVEGRLKAGLLPAVIATASLELGIDVGSIDRVILAGTPPGISQAIQRAGRSGHGVGQVSRIELMPFHGVELIVAAALVREARRGTLEETVPVSNPLDVLAQVLLALILEGPRTADALYDMIIGFSPFETLPRVLFDSTLELLRGRWDPSDGRPRPRELQARVYLDLSSGLVEALKGSRQLLWTSGGTIPDRGLFSLRMAGDGTRIGELDEEFVFERKVGDSFSLGSQSWRITEIGAEAVNVAPLDRPADFVPFWKGGALHSSGELARATLELLGQAESCFDDGKFSKDFLATLESECALSGDASEILCDFLARQKAAQSDVPLPGPDRVVVESISVGRGAGGAAAVIHTFRGGRINEGLAFLVAAALAASAGPDVQTQADDEGVLVMAPEAEGGRDFVDRVAVALRSFGGREPVLQALRLRLEASGLFAAAFRENAGRALLLPKGFGGRRRPLWLSRLKAARLFAAVRNEGDFPITVETWRSVLSEAVDLEGLVSLMIGLAEGRVAIGSFVSSEPSPFASGAAWVVDGAFMYRDDDLSGGSASISAEAVALALESPRHRPLLDPAVVAEFILRRKRLLPGWAPDGIPELLAWVEERLAIPASEFAELLRAGHLEDSIAGDPTAGGRLVVVRIGTATEDLILVSGARESLKPDSTEWLAEWLRGEGPVDAARMHGLFGLDEETFHDIAAALVANGSAVFGLLVRNGNESLIDRENYESLLKAARRAARPAVRARPAGDLCRFLLQAAGNSETGSLRRMAGLAGYPAPLRSWIDEILPSRFGADWERVIEGLQRDEGWLWFGTGRESIAFADVWNYELFGQRGLSSSIVPAVAAPADFWTLRERDGRSVREFALALWKEAWEGRVVCDSFSPVLQGRSNRFGHDLADTDELPERNIRGRAVPPLFRHRWRSGAPVGGLWSALGLEGEGGDALDDDEIDRERVRILLRRYGILARPLFERELDQLSWKRLFPALRRMELAGEIVCGHFFEGLAPPQFLSPDGLERFRRLDALESPGPLWMSAYDPANPLGLVAGGGLGLSAPRSPSISLCVAEDRVVARTRRSGQVLEFLPDLANELRREILSRWAATVGKVRLETIDGAPAADADMADSLLALGFERDRGALRRWSAPIRF